MYIVGDEATVKWTGQLAGKGGDAVSFEGIDVMMVDDGKTQTLRAYWDPAPVVAVLQE